MIPQTQQPPAVIFWFKFYAGSLCFLYLLTAGFSFFFFFADPSQTEIPKVTAQLIGVFMLVISLVLIAVCLLPFILTPRPWLWVYNLVIICLGMTSACYLLVCIPLLIFWLKPETQRYYGKNVI